MGIPITAAPPAAAKLVKPGEHRHQLCEVLPSRNVVERSGHGEQAVDPTLASYVPTWHIRHAVCDAQRAGV